MRGFQSSMQRELEGKPAVGATVLRCGRFAPPCQSFASRDPCFIRQGPSTLYGVVFAFFVLAGLLRRLHRPERDGIAALLDRRDAVLPLRPRLAVHHVKRARQGFERVALPSLAVASPEAEFTGRAERQAEDLVKVSFVAVPADPDADVIFGAEYLADAAVRQAGPCFDLTREGPHPVRNRLRLGEPLQRIVIAIAERRDPAVALEGAELETLKRQCCDAADHLLFNRGVDEI